jgi:hypothetical protein
MNNRNLFLTAVDAGKSKLINSALDESLLLQMTEGIKEFSVF